MKKVYEYIGLSALIVFSFYFTNQVRIYIQNKNPLVKEIIAKSDNYNIEAIDAVIKDNTIIPGLNGREINVTKSFNKMKEFGLFNDTFLVYKIKKPRISLRNNLDKIIIRGNSNKKQVSLLFEYSDLIINYLVTNEINANVIVHSITDTRKELENINNVINKTEYKKTDNYLRKNKLENNLCLSDNSHNCSGKMIIRPTHILTNVNYAEIKNSISNGSIIVVKKSVDISIVKALINQLNFNDIDVVFLSKLISENND